MVASRCGLAAATGGLRRRSCSEPCSRAATTADGDDGRERDRTDQRDVFAGLAGLEERCFNGGGRAAGAGLGAPSVSAEESEAALGKLIARRDDEEEKKRRRREEEKKRKRQI